MDAYVIEQKDASCGVRLIGDLTASVVPSLQAALRHNLPPGVREVRFDLQNATLVDSSGIGLLIATRNTLAPRGGTVSVSGVSPDLFQLLQSMRLVTRLNVSARPA